MDNCVFCRIVRGELPCAALMESDRVISFLDINPVNPGHALVAPKTHVEDLMDADTGDLHECIQTVQKVARAAVAATDAEGFNVLQNNGRCAGQVVPHLHFHVIPRRADDGFGFGWRQGRYGDSEMDELRRKIMDELNAGENAP